MKNLYCKMAFLCLWGLFALQPVSAQDDLDTTYAARMKYIFKYLDKSKVPFGLLKDLSLELAELGNYDGIKIADTNLVYHRNWDDIYKTLAFTQIHASATPNLPHPEQVDSTWNANRKPGQVTLAGLYYKYSRFADDAQNKVSIINEQIYDKYLLGVIWLNPYKTEQVMAFSPANLECPDPKVNFMLPAEMWLSNQKAQVLSIQLDPGDGLGYRPINPGIALPVLYPDSGLKVLKFKIVLSNNMVLQSRSVLHVRKSAYYYEPIEALPVEEQAKGQPESMVNNGQPDQLFLPFIIPPVTCLTGQTDAQGIEKLYFRSTENFNGSYAYGIVTIIYAQADHKLRKPLIVAEGFDPGDPENLNGVYTVKDFKDEVYKSGELDNLINSTPDYDLIFIDWLQGTGDIRQNALLLKQVIRCVNQKKVANNGQMEQNVVIGQSMGGVIARYALKKMEDTGENHDVRLFVSHDAPHQGANVALSLQAMNTHMRKLAAKAFIGVAIHDLFSKNDIKDQLGINETAAAKQLEIYHMNKWFQLDNTIHNEWQNELINTGYPQNCRNIAISNGSECGSDLPYTPGSNLMLYDGKYQTTLLSDFLASCFAPLIGLSTGSLKIGLLSLLPGNNKIDVYFSLKSLIEGGGNTIYSGKIVYKKKILWFIPVTTTLTSRSYTAPNGLKSYDLLPGGYYKFNIDIENDDNIIIKNNIKLDINEGFSLISTVSALDIGRGLVQLDEIDYKTPYVGAMPPSIPKNSPFDNFITSYYHINYNPSENLLANNKEHISFEPRNGKWLANELSQNQPNPSANCQLFCALDQIDKNSISGPNCFSLNANYTFNNLPNGLSIIWSVTGSAIINGPNNTTNVSLSANGIGPATLTAHIPSSNCGDYYFKKNIDIGILTPQISYTFIMGNVPVWYTFMVNNPSKSLVYKWYVNDVLTYTSQPGESTFLYTGKCNTYYNVKCMAISDCTSSGFSNVLLPGKTCLSAYHFAPNPVDKELKVFYSDEFIQEFERLNESLPVFEIRIYNNKGVQLLKKQSLEGIRVLSLNTSTLPNGIYYLHIKQGEQLIKKQVIVQH